MAEAAPMQYRRMITPALPDDNQQPEHRSCRGVNYLFLDMHV